jgi:CheY-like chemotaxis protein
MAKQTVLVADDDKVFVQAISEIVRARGCDVIVAFDAIQALMLATRTPLAAAIIDVNMPGGTGRGLIQKLRASGRTSQVPIIAVSGLTDRALPAELRRLGASAFLPKPVQPATLNQTLDDLLEPA